MLLNMKMFWELVTTEEPIFLVQKTIYKYSETFAKICRNKTKLVYIKAALNLGNVLISEVFNEKGCFSENWVTRRILLFIFVRGYIVFSYI